VVKQYLTSARARLGLALGISSLSSVGLFMVGALSNHSAEFAYLNWNLFLAWVPLLLTWWLVVVLRTRLWSSWLALAITIAWVSFLPNSFYMISDFIHIQQVRRVDLLYDVVMFSSFIFNGVVLGFVSLYLVHQELLKRVRQRTAAGLIALVLVLSCIAIYLGRELRWNTWDILVNPAGILVDISNRVLDPRTYPQFLATTLSFFVLIAALYLVTWQIVSTVRATAPQPAKPVRKLRRRNRSNS
jgi:uncharacterized membrane protein